MILFLNSIAGSEIVIILLFVLIFFGAKSIPGMSRSLGRGIRQIKDAGQDIQDEISRSSRDMKRDMNINRTLHDAKKNVEKPFENISRSAEDMKRSIEDPGHHPSSSPEKMGQHEKNRVIKEEPTKNKSHDD